MRTNLIAMKHGLSAHEHDIAQLLERVARLCLALTLAFWILNFNLFCDVSVLITAPYPDCDGQGEVIALVVQ